MNTPVCLTARENGGTVPLDCLFACTRGCAEKDEEGPRVIIAGSRTVTSFTYVEHAMGVATRHLGWGPFVRVVSGAARGVDRLGERWAHQHSIAVKSFPVSPAEWQAQPRSAGHARNTRMAEYATHLVAIWDGRSGGTAHMIQAAQARGLPTLIGNIATGKYETRNIG